MDNIDHVRDDAERLRTRVLRRLLDDITLLQDGLAASKESPPKMYVTVDHLERVIDSLRVEVGLLMAGNK